VASPSRAEAYRKTVLPNGIRVVTESLPWVRSVAVGIWVETGSRVEAVERGGDLSAEFRRLGHEVIEPSQNATKDRISWILGRHALVLVQLVLH